MGSQKFEVRILQRGDRVPHFDVEQMDGSRARYADLWQMQNLLLLSLSDDEHGAFVDYAARLVQHRADFSAEQTALVVTRAQITGVPRPGVVIADRWGEIYSVVDARSASDLPTVDDLFEWLRYLQHVCPECQGEAK